MVFDFLNQSVEQQIRGENGIIVYQKHNYFVRGLSSQSLNTIIERAQKQILIMSNSNMSF